jgi:hypothetical protein
MGEEPNGRKGPAVVRIIKLAMPTRWNRMVDVEPTRGQAARSPKPVSGVHHGKGSPDATPSAIPLPEGSTGGKGSGGYRGVGKRGRRRRHFYVARLLLGLSFAGP